MNVLSSQEFIKNATDLQSLANSVALPPEVKAQVEIEKKRSEILKRIASTGLSFDYVVTKDGPQNAAAFVQTDTMKSYIALGTLDNPEMALEAGYHEAEHLRNRVFNLDFSNFLDQDERKILAEALSISPDELDQINWIEGFTQAITLYRTPADDQSIYSFETKSAQKLNQFVKDQIGHDLFSVFQVESLASFKNRLATAVCGHAINRKKYLT